MDARQTPAQDSWEVIMQIDTRTASKSSTSFVNAFRATNTGAHGGGGVFGRMGGSSKG